MKNITSLHKKNLTLESHISKMKILKIHPKDNVQVALTVLYKGEQAGENAAPVVLQENIPAKHKFALTELNEGDAVIMYGVLVGKATKHIAKGGLLTTQNIKHAAGK